MKVLLATNNKTKIEKWGTLIKKLGYELLTLADLKDSFEEPKEDGKTALENALKKAEFYYNRTGIVTIATDASLYINGLSEEEQIGLFAGREVTLDKNRNIISEKELSDDESFERYNKIINKLGGKVKGYFDESFAVYYGTGAYEHKTFRMNREFKTPPSPVRKTKAPMRSFVYYSDINKYRSELDNETANRYDADAYCQQVIFLNVALYKASHMADYNFNILRERILDSNDNVIFDDFENTLKSINEPCLCIGSGGSASVGHFASQVLSAKNNIISFSLSPRDVLYRHDLNQFKHLLAITYGNKNYGIDRALEKAKLEGLKTYVLTNNPKSKDDYHKLLYYGNTIEKEHSFISIASSFIPMSLLLRYYLDCNYKEFENVINNCCAPKIDINEHELTGVEIMAGDNTYTAAEILKSTIREAGIGIPVVHEKYDYFHGGSTLAYYQNSKNILIYLINGEYKEIDEKLLSNVFLLYREVIVLDTDQKDAIVGELELSIKGMYLLKMLGQNIGRDISKFEYAPQVKRLYNSRPEM